ncbi:MAG: DUF1800 family protein [Verrucomicrobiota bacterium]
MAGPLGDNDLEPAVVRVRNITTTGFEIQIDEWDYLDGVHSAEDIGWLAMEPGLHSLAGLTWEVGRATGIGTGFTTVNLTAGFSSAPVVISQIETINSLVAADNPVALAGRQENVGAASFQVKVQREEGSSASITPEDVGYIAVSEGTGLLGGAPITVARTGDVVTHSLTSIAFPGLYNGPIFLARQQVEDGGNTAVVRSANVTETGLDVWIEEEQANDAELNHTTEDVGYIVLGTSAGENQAKFEVGEITTDQLNSSQWHSVSFADTYTNPVVVLGPLSYNDGEPATTRVRGVTSTGFEFQIDEWDYLDGVHGEETLSYIVMEAGRYEMGGLEWEAGTVAGIDGSRTTVPFGGTFGSTPVVFAEVVTDNEPNAVESRLRTINGSSFDVELDRQEGGGTHGAETLAYIAIESGSASFVSNGTFFEVAASTDTIDEVWEAVNFVQGYFSPYLIADDQTRDGGDTAAVRYRNLGALSTEFLIEEEQAANSEVGHTNEVVGFFVLAAMLDTDGDGMPDDYELANGFDPADGADASLDADSDNFSNLEEFQMGTDPNSPNILTIDVIAESNSAFEKEGTTATFRIDRTVPEAAVTVFLTLGTTVDPSVGSSDPSDYVATTGGGGAFSGSITFPVGVTSDTITIAPVDDGVAEYPEVLNVTITPHADYTIGASASAEIDIVDATDDPANDRLFVGFYQPEGAAVTSASGITSLVINGSNTVARISNSFSGLSSPQSNTHVHKATLDGGGVTLLSGPIVEEITTTGNDGDPVLLGQLTDYEWLIEPAGANTVTQLIDSLYGQNDETPLYINVHTNNYMGGEIWAFYAPANGSTEPPAPPAPPTIEFIDPVAEEETLRREIARFLTQATFGPTPAEIDAMYAAILADPGQDRMAVYNQWITDQLALDQTLIAGYTLAADNQEWEQRGHFDYTGAPALPATWTSIPTHDPDTLDYTDAATFPIPDAVYPLTQAEINDGKDIASAGEVNHNNRRRAQWTAMVNANDQLRQRLGFAWQEIMVISEALATVRTRHIGAARYIDMLAENADDSFREMLEGVTYSPMMGKYLSHLKNQQATDLSDPPDGIPDILPDENYAREIMQLFSIGLVQLWQDGSLRLDPNTGLVQATYDNTDITELSKIMTGWSFSRYSNNKDQWAAPLTNSNFTRGDGNKYYGHTYTHPMRLFGDFHDPGVKTIAGGQLIDNTAEPDLDLRAAADVSDALDWFGGAEGDPTYDGHPSTPAFISYRLIQRLVTSNPSNGYVYRVAQVFNDTNGDLGEVARAILTDYEARSMTFVGDPTYGKMKEPLVRYMQLLRGLDTTTQLPISELGSYRLVNDQLDNFLLDARFRYGETDGNLQQTPLQAPTVFNWFLPDYRPGGPIASAALVAPEFQVATETSVIQAINYFYTITWSNGSNSGQGLNTLSNQTALGYPADADHAKTDRQAWIDRYNGYGGATELDDDTALVDDLDMILMSGNFKARYPYDPNDGVENPREIIIDLLGTFGTSNNNKRDKVRTAFYLMSVTPEYIIQK